MPKCKYKRNVLKYHVSNYLQEAENDESHFQYFENREKLNSELKSLSLHRYKFLIKNLMPMRED